MGKSYEKKVYAVLRNTQFIIGEREKRLIRERTKNGRRYFFMVANRLEQGKEVERFIKVPANNTKKLLEPFERQIEVAKYLKQYQIIPTRGVVESNVDLTKGSPFVIMETFPKAQAKIGFIEQDRGSEKLSRREAKSVFVDIEKLHAINISSLPKSLRKLLKKYPNIYESLTQQLWRALRGRVLPLDSQKGKQQAFERVVTDRLKQPDFHEEVKVLLEKWHSIITDPANRCPTFIHGDLAPNNLYVFDSGMVELLDYEWAGFSNNAAIAMIFDYGHMRARAWGSEEFREALDAELIKAYAKNGKKNSAKPLSV